MLDHFKSACSQMCDILAVCSDLQIKINPEMVDFTFYYDKLSFFVTAHKQAAKNMFVCACACKVGYSSCYRNIDHIIGACFPYEDKKQVAIT